MDTCGIEFPGVAFVDIEDMLDEPVLQEEGDLHFYVLLPGAEALHILVQIREQFGVDLFVGHQILIASFLHQHLLIGEVFGRQFQHRFQTLLQQVDVQPRQILIEAKILEVRLDRSEAFGVDWSKIVGGSDRSYTVGTRGLADRAGSGLFFSVVSDNLNIYLSALASKGRVHTLATPKLLALENQQAITSIGDQTGYKVTTTINQVTTESIQFLESGVILRVTPSIDERGRILMKIHPEVSTASVNNSIPSKNSTQGARARASWNATGRRWSRSATTRRRSR